MNATEKLLMRTDRKSLVGELQKAGTTFKGNSCCCPYHDDRTASAGIYEDSMGVWRFHCQASGCGVKGDYYDIKSRNENKSLADIFRQLSPPADEKPKRKSYTILQEAIEDAAQTAHGQLEAVYEYTNPQTKEIELAVARITGTAGKTFRQFSPGSGGWVAQAPSKPWPLYNRSRILNKPLEIIVVEGEKCVHALHEYGIVATTSPCGAGKAEHADWTLLAGKSVILWPDNDDAGRKHMGQVQAILQRLSPIPRIRRIEPAELELAAKEDCVDFIQQIKTLDSNRTKVQAELLRVIETSHPVSIAQEVGERLEKIIAGEWFAVNLPWKTLSSSTQALLPGTVCLLVGSVGHGKSYMLLEMLAYFQANGYEIACFELEEDRVYHLSRLLAQMGELPGMVDSEWLSTNQEKARNAYSEHRDQLEQLGSRIWATPEHQPSIEEIGEWVENRCKAGCRVIAVDPITAVTPSSKPWISDNDFMQRIKRAAVDSGASVVLVTHPAKAVFKYPDVNQLAGGAAYGRFAQTIMWLEAHEAKDSLVRTPVGTTNMTHTRTIHIIKARNARGGGLSLAFEFHQENMTLSELGVICKK